MALPSLNNVKKRTIFIVGVILFGFLCVILRMAWWQIIRGNELAETAKRMQTSQTVERANRGKILDRNGKILAESASVKTLVCNPQDVQEYGDIDKCVEAIAPIIDMSEAKLKACFEENSQYRIIKKRLTAEESMAIEEMINPKYEDETSKEAELRNESKKELKNALSGLYFENDS